MSVEKKSRSTKPSATGSGGSGGGLFRLKFRRPDSRGRSGQRHCEMAEGSSSNADGGQLNIQQWGNEEVAAWLESLQLEEYQDDFIRHDIRGPELLTLERRDLKELGIHKVGHIKRIQQAIWEIKETARSQS